MVSVISSSSYYSDVFSCAYLSSKFGFEYLIEAKTPWLTAVTDSRLVECFYRQGLDTTPPLNNHHWAEMSKGQDGDAHIRDILAWFWRKWRHIIHLYLQSMFYAVAVSPNYGQICCFCLTLSDETFNKDFLRSWSLKMKISKSKLNSLDIGAGEDKVW